MINQDHDQEAGCGMKIKFPFISREVRVGNCPLGGANPIRLQSMTSTTTGNTEATVVQAMRIFDAGADYVRISVPGLNDAKNLMNIKKELLKRGYTGSLIADVQFNPEIAETAACFVEKVRINPGNYYDKRIAVISDNTDEKKSKVQIAVRKRFLKLLDICNRHNTALRIGTNHGSLSQRIVNCYGDTPEGMVEATMEFLHICRDADFHNVVVSLKSSNTRVMIQANRLMVFRMIMENMNYPLHLGVTEAGEADDGRIKSAVGIGTLLAEGIGDTIRVSLTEPPENEIHVARTIAGHCFGNKNTYSGIFTSKCFYPFVYNRRAANCINNTGNNKPPVVIADFNREKKLPEKLPGEAGYRYNKNSDKWENTGKGADYIYTGDKLPSGKYIDQVQHICNFKIWQSLKGRYGNVFPLFTVDEYMASKVVSSVMNFISIKPDKLPEKLTEKLRNDKTAVLVLETGGIKMMAIVRNFFDMLFDAQCKAPVVARRFCYENELTGLQIKSSCDTGFLFIDGLCDGLWLSVMNHSVTNKSINSTAFGILQACRARFSKTEYISCPSCSRTLFDIQKVTGQIRKKTSNLKNLKIAIMGCIVNGPGEMADADYGYVGAGRGKVNLYKGKQLIKRNILSDNAVNELIAMIKENSDWIV